MDRVIALELELLGSHGMAAHDYPAMLRRWRPACCAPTCWSVPSISLDEAPAALAALGDGSPAGMTVIAP